MSSLSVDYAGIMSALPRPLDTSTLGQVLFDAFARAYQAACEECALHEFEQVGAHYLFDLASPENLPQEDRTVAAWALTPERIDTRDTEYQRGFPLTPKGHEPPVDRGHAIPHLSGGMFGPNIFAQDRALNRGWSAEGKRYRALEREAARTPDTFFVVHLIYSDDTAYPAIVEVGLLRGQTDLHVERFNNRPAAT